MKVAVVLPFGTVTAVGTDADGVLLDSDTTASPVGAGPDSVAVHLAVDPPVTLPGLSERADTLSR